MALHVALSRPRSDGGKGQRLLFRPQDRDRRSAVRACRRARPASGADRQFRRRQIFAGEGRRARSAQAPGLARGCPRAQCLAAGFPGQPPMVLPVAQARHRSAQGAGRVVPRHLAVRRHRLRADQAAKRLDRAVARRQGDAVGPDRSHRTPPQGARSSKAAGLFSLRRPGRGALRARRGRRSAGASPS